MIDFKVIEGKYSLFYFSDVTGSFEQFGAFTVNLFRNLVGFESRHQEFGE